MLKQNKTKLSMMVLAIAMLGTAMLITNPGMAFGQGTVGDMLRNITEGNTTQGNMSGGNMTAVIDVDTLSKNIKERHPILAQMMGDEDKDIMIKIKGMDAKEAAKTTIALNLLRLLQEYKELDAE